MLSRNTLSCSVLPLSSQFSIWAKYPQNLLVSLWFVDHWLFKESLERLNFLSLWKVDQILSQNVVCFWSIDVTAFKLTLSHTDTSLMSSSTVKLFPRWILLVVDFFCNGGCRLSHFNLEWRLMDIHVWMQSGHQNAIVKRLKTLFLVLYNVKEIRDFVSPSPNKHQSNSEAALISNKIEVEIYLLDNGGEKNWQR